MVYGKWNGKRIKRAVLSWILCLAMVIGMTPIQGMTVKADGDVAELWSSPNDKIGSYETLQAAFTAAESQDEGVIVKLLEDVTAAEDLTLNQTINLFLNGHTFTLSEGVSLAPSGTYSGDSAPTIDLWSGFSSGAGGSLVSSGNIDASIVIYSEDVSVSIEGGTVSSLQSFPAGATVTMTDGLIDYLMVDGGVVSVSGGTVTKAEIMNEARVTTLNISGTATVSQLVVDSFTGMTDENENYCNTTVNISGTPVLESLKVSIGDSGEETEESCTQISITGGRFGFNPDYESLRQEMINAQIDAAVKEYSEPYWGYNENNEWSELQHTEEEIAAYRQEQENTVTASVTSAWAKGLVYSVTPAAVKKDDYWIVGDDSGDEPAGIISATATDYTGTYDRRSHTIDVKVTEPASGYTIEYGKEAGTYDMSSAPTFKDAGTYTVFYRITADGYAPKTGSATVQIDTCPIDDAVITLSDTQRLYTGSEQSVTVESVVLSRRALEADTEYELSGTTDATDVGTYTVTATGKGNYSGSASAQWSIVEEYPQLPGDDERSDTSVAAVTYRYRGTEYTDYATKYFDSVKEAFEAADADFKYLLPEEASFSYYMSPIVTLLTDATLNETAALGTSIALCLDGKTLTVGKDGVINGDGISFDGDTPGTFTSYGTVHPMLSTWYGDTLNFEAGVADGGLGVDGGTINIKGGAVSIGYGMFNNGGAADIAVTISGDAMLQCEDLGNAKFVIYPPSSTNPLGEEGGTPDIYLTLNGGYYQQNPKALYMTYDEETGTYGKKYVSVREILEGYTYYKNTEEGYTALTTEATQEELNSGSIYICYSDFVTVDETKIEQYTDQTDWAADAKAYPWRIAHEAQGGGEESNPNPTVTEYTVTFNTNGGSAVTAQNVASGEKATKPADPTKQGSTFAGWYADAALTTAYDFTAAVTADVTVYAKWTENGGTTPDPDPQTKEYTVTFNTNGGSAVAEQRVKSGEKATKPTDPTKESFTFAGWYADAALTISYDFAVAVTADVTVYAKWTENTNPTPEPAPAEVKMYGIHVTGNAKATDVKGTVVTSAKEKDVITITWMPRTGYEFVKWTLTGATAADATAATTTFTVGTRDVTVSYEEKLSVQDEVIEERPADADTTTKVSKVKFEKAKLTLNQSGAAVANPAQATAASGAQLPTLYYVTENADIVAVDQSGNFYPVGQGEATVTAYCGNKKATCKVTVVCYTESIAVMDESGADVTGSTVQMQGGEQAFFTVSFRPYDSTDPRAVTWRSDNKSVTVKNGIVTAKEVAAETTAVITATVKATNPSTGKQESKSQTVTVKVSPIVIEKVSKADKSHTLALKKKALKLTTEQGKDTATLEITVTSKNKQLAVANGDFEIESCESTNENVVTVGSVGALLANGKKGIAKVILTAEGAGTAYIIVKSRSSEDDSTVNVQRCKVTVSSPATSVSIESGSLNIQGSSGQKTLTMRKGESGTVEIVVSPEFTTDYGKVKLTGSGGITVKNGIITAKKVTKKPAKLTVKCGKLKEEVLVTVVK